MTNDADYWDPEHHNRIVGMNGPVSGVQFHGPLSRRLHLALRILRGKPVMYRTHILIDQLPLRIVTNHGGSPIGLHMAQNTFEATVGREGDQPFVKMAPIDELEQDVPAPASPS